MGAVLALALLLSPLALAAVALSALGEARGARFEP